MEEIVICRFKTNIKNGIQIENENLSSDRKTIKSDHFVTFVRIKYMKHCLLFMLSLFFPYYFHFWCTSKNFHSYTDTAVL